VRVTHRYGASCADVPLTRAPRGLSQRERLVARAREAIRHSERSERSDAVGNGLAGMRKLTHMPLVDLIVRAPHALTMEGDGVGYQADSALAIDRGRIVGLGPASDVLAEFSAERSINAEHHVLLPGFVDAHMHSALCLLRGLAQDTRHWMMYGLCPFSAQLSADAMEAGSRLAIVEGLKAGTTTFGDFGWSMDGVCSFIEQVGARGAIAVTIREATQRIYSPGDLYSFEPALGRAQFQENLRVFECWNGAAGGRLRVLFGPQGPDFVSRDLLLEVQRAARERHAKIHMHTAQGDRETAQMLMRYARRSIAWLDDLGYLDPTLLAVHLTDASEDEAKLVAARGASMALCSGSIGIIDGIVPPAAAFQAAGGMVALGSDQAPGNNCHNLFNEMKLTALFNKIRASDPEAMPAWRVLRMATIEGATALGWADEIGSLAIGKRADLVLVDVRRLTLSPVHTRPMRNLVPNLVYSARGDEVDTVVVDGQVLVEGGRVVTVDEDAIVAEAQRLAGPIGAAAEADFWRVGGTNAQFMRDGRL
jgi:5-methylthioadenosine/S-adenosylhomocysteine deaminase